MYRVNGKEKILHFGLRDVYFSGRVEEKTAEVGRWGLKAELAVVELP